MDYAFFHAAATAGIRDGGIALPPGVLRFTMVFRAPPDPQEIDDRLRTLFGASGFDLFRPPAVDDPNILVLQFSGVPREQSPSYLIARANDLVEVMDLESCDPDAEAGWRAEDELGRAAPESLGGIAWELCRSHAAPPPESRWSVKMIKADVAWERFGVIGAGVRIGQPDTGVTDHRELDDALDLASGVDIIAGGGAPIDPLRNMDSPGHGTATSSVVASRRAGRMTGAAPGAQLVPIRCVNSVILTSGAATAGAIDHARAQGCHIVTMSLGGPFSFQVLARAIERAVAADMIVVAAAGNCVGFVVYPAWDANVIAVAAIDSRGQRWPGSCHGPKVDISAPGENVYVARRTTPDDRDLALVEPGEGTSFAVTAVAGCAALWLEKHGIDAIRAAARARRISVQELFRAALRQTAHRPASWDPADMGAGVVDAESLLGLKLADIASPGAPREGHPLADELGAGFDWKRHGLEGGFLAFDAAQRSNPRRAAALESPVAARPSPAFLDAAARAGASADHFRPANDKVLLPPVTPPLRGDRPLARLAKLPSGGAEASGAITESSARAFLKGGGGSELVDLLDAALSDASRRAETHPEVEKLRQQVRDAAPGVVKDFVDGTARSSADFKGVRLVAAEALIRLTGRPALRVIDGEVDKNDPRLGAWAADLYLPRNTIRPLFEAVGRIEIMEDGKPLHIGTGTHIAPGIVMTNRHVMEAFAEVLPGAIAPRRFEMTAEAAIIFDDAASDPTKRFKIKGVLMAGPQPIGRLADPAKLDVALLNIETGPETPPPVKVSQSAMFGATGAKSLAVVGYPVKPSADQFVDPETHAISDKIADVLWALYGRDYGVKYVSPGEVMKIEGGLIGDPRGWAFAHDATTLPGNSGSSIFALGPDVLISGLHFGGAPMRVNMAHDLGVVRKVIAKDVTLIGVDWPV